MVIPAKYIHLENLIKSVGDLDEMCDVTLIAGIDKQK